MKSGSLTVGEVRVVVGRGFRDRIVHPQIQSKFPDHIRNHRILHDIFGAESQVAADLTSVEVIIVEFYVGKLGVVIPRTSHQPSDLNRLHVVLLTQSVLAEEDERVVPNPCRAVLWHNMQ